MTNTMAPVDLNRMEEFIASDLEYDHYKRVKPMLAEIRQLRGNLSLAEEGLANYALEIERVQSALKSVQNLAGGHPIECECRQCEIFELLEPIVGNTSPRASSEPLPPQAPIAKLIVHEDNQPWEAVPYAPGLPPGVHDVYLDPSAPALKSSDWRLTSSEVNCGMTIDDIASHFYPAGRRDRYTESGWQKWEGHAQRT